MKAITIKQPGGAEQLQLKEYDKPQPQAGELLIKVGAAAVNRTDIITRENGSGPIKSPILGVEVAGVVEEPGKAAI